MKFEEAAKRLRDLAHGKHCAIDYEVALYTDNTEKARIRLYIADTGFTEYQRSYELAFAEMGYMLSGMPTIAEQLPPMFEGATDETL